MKLNMTIISDYLDSQDIKRKQTNRLFSFLPGKRGGLHRRKVPGILSLHCRCRRSSGCSGGGKQYITDLYRKTAGNLQADTLRILCVEEGTDITGLFQKAAEIFRWFQDIEVRILRCLVDHAPMNEIGRIFFEVLENPVSFATPVFRIMMYVPGKKNHDKNFSLAENAYLPEDEYMVVVSDPEYKETLKTKIPGIFSEKMYGFRKIYYNIFHRQEYLGSLWQMKFTAPAGKVICHF